MDNVNEKRGSVITGFVGAFIGALIGAVLWTLIGLAGYVASIVGFVIAFLAGKGYDLCKGRKGTAKVVVLIVCVLLAVLIGNFGTYALDIHNIYQEELSYLTDEEKQDVVSEEEFFMLIMTDSEVQIDFVKDCAIGVVFAALGCFTEIRNAGMKKNLKARLDEEKKLKESEVSEDQE